MKQHTSVWGLIIVVFASLFLTACSGLNDRYVEEAKRLPASIEAMEGSLLKKKAAFQTLKKSEDWAFLLPYDASEKWEQYFVQAEQEIQRAKKMNSGQVTKILKADKPEDDRKLVDAIAAVNKILASARDTMAKPSERAAFLITAKKTAPKILDKARNENGSVQKLFADASAKAKKTKSDYPQKGSQVDAQFMGLKKLADDSKMALVRMEGEFEKISSGSIDYAVFGDSASMIETNLSKLTKGVPVFKKTQDQLYRSYDKKIVDMEKKFYVVLGYSTWDSCCDGSRHQREGKLDPILVSEEVYEYFSAVGDSIARRYTGWGGSWNVKVPSQHVSMYKMLNPDLSTAQWPRGFDDSEFWVADTIMRGFHKYEEVSNGQVSKTDWVEISEDNYWKYENDLGMVILSKPYGYYESEAVTKATPPGMTHIAKPTMVDGKPTGSNEYGQWKTNSDGTSFWEFYGQYRLITDLLGGSNYGYNDYRDYSRRDPNSGYYAGGRYGTWGSETYKKGSRYTHSSHATKNPGTVRESRAASSNRATGRRTTGSRSQSASVRGGSSSSRHRGPNSRGK